MLNLCRACILHEKQNQRPVEVADSGTLLIIQGSKQDEFQDYQLCDSLLCKNVTVTTVDDGQSSNTEKLSTRSSKLDVVSSVVVDVALGQHSVVLELRFSQRWGVC